MRAFQSLKVLSTHRFSWLQRTSYQAQLQRLTTKLFPVLVLLIGIAQRAPEFPGGGTGR